MSNEPILHDEGDDEVEGFRLATPVGPTVGGVLDGIALPSPSTIARPAAGIGGYTGNANEPVVTDDGDDVEGFGLTFATPQVAPDGPPIKPALDGPSSASTIRMGNWANANEPVIEDGDDEVEGFGLSLSLDGPPIKPVLDGLAMPTPGSQPSTIRRGDVVSDMGGVLNANEPVIEDGDDEVQGFSLSLSLDGPPIKPVLDGLAMPTPGSQPSTIRRGDVVSDMGGVLNANEPVIEDGDDEVQGFGLSLSPDGPPIKPVLDGLAMPTVGLRPDAIRPGDLAKGAGGSWQNANEPIMPAGPPIKPVLDGLAMDPAAARSEQIHPGALARGAGGAWNNANEPALTDGDTEPGTAPGTDELVDDDDR